MLGTRAGRRLGTTTLLCLAAACGGSGKGAGTIEGRALLRGESSHAGTMVRLEGPAGPLESAVTDANGGYRFVGLQRGSYSVVASATSTVQGSLGALVTVAPSATANAPELSFDPLGEVKGTVRLGVAGGGGIVVTV